MKVKALIAELGKFDQDLEILGFSEDEELVPDKHIFRLLDIDGVDVAVGGRHRGDDIAPDAPL